MSEILNAIKDVIVVVNVWNLCQMYYNCVNVDKPFEKEKYLVYFILCGGAALTTLGVIYKNNN